MKLTSPRADGLAQASVAAAGRASAARPQTGKIASREVIGAFLRNLGRLERVASGDAGARLERRPAPRGR